MPIKPMTTRPSKERDMAVIPKMSRYPKRSNQTGQYTDEAFGGAEAAILFTDRWIFKYI
jgi:hypothetical protein